MRRSCFHLLVAAACGAIVGPMDAQAYRMVQNTSVLRTSTGIRVLCNDPLGFTHRAESSVSWRLNTANQGGKAGVAAALQNALASWTNVSPAGYVLTYGGTTNAGFATDGINTVLWANGNGCTGGCLAITALVLGPGQVITEADVSFNDAANWNTNGTDYDTQAIASHEFGHGMGIHHTEITRKHNRPTMYTAYFGTDGRTLETDDRDALNCAAGRYPPLTSAVLAVETPMRLADASGPRLMPRMQGGQATLRFGMKAEGFVRLDVFDVAGRHLTTLVNGIRGAGEHEVAWGGETPSGRVGSGLYFARIVTPDGKAGATIVLRD
jgi:hypothetical protein